MDSPDYKSIVGASLGSLVSTAVWDRVQYFWGDFALSYGLFLITGLWLIESLLELCHWLREGRASLTNLVKICGRWLVWVAILFVSFSLRKFEPLLALLSSTLELVVLLTQSLYVLRGAAKVMGKSLASRVLRLFESQLEQKLEQVLNQLQVVCEQKQSLEQRLERLEKALPDEANPTPKEGQP